MNEQINEQVVCEQSCWNRVTPLSKYLAMALFVILPFAGFWLGVEYALKQHVVPEYLVVQSGDLEEQKELIQQNADTTVISSADSKISSGWRMFNSPDDVFSISFPTSFEVYDGTEDFIYHRDDGISTKNSEFYILCDGSRVSPQPKGEGSWPRCTNEAYNFGISIKDGEINEETIKSWGAEIVKYKKIVINSMTAWMVYSGVGAESTDIFFNQNGRYVSFVSTSDLYSDIEDQQKVSLVEEILNTLVIK